MLNGIKKVLFTEEVQNQNCLWCKEKLTGNQRRFCSDRCNNYHYRFVDKYGREPTELDLKKLKGGLKK